MRQLFQNLIGNALKFHRAGAPPRITIDAHRLDSTGDADGDRVRWEISFADNGVGFDEKYLDRIFKLFQRLHERHTYEGAGMGLAICRKIAERHGGSITARSKPGIGSTFLVTLPEHQRHMETIA
jgi:signal transduction histidine kinase